MHKRKQIWLWLSILSLILLSLQCNLSSGEAPTRPADSVASTASPEGPVEAEQPEEAEETPTPTPGPTSTPAGGLVQALAENPVWFLLPLLFIAALLLLLLRLRRRSKARPPETPRPSTAPLVPWDETVEIERPSYLTLVADVEPPPLFPLEQESVTIGRAEENDLVIDERFPGYQTVSRRHARLYRRAGHWVIEDLDSRNGVYVNQQRTGRNLLREGWYIGIGGVTFQFHSKAGEEARA